MELAIHGKSSKVNVDDAVFDRAFNESLVHQVVTAWLAGARSGSKQQKNRSDVSGGGAKPWRQKGTGRARAGTTTGPIWRGGGVTFAARPRKFDQKVNKKMYRGAMSAIVSELVRADRLVVVDAFDCDSPRTRDLLAKLAELDFDRGLIVDAEPDENLTLAARNVVGLEVTHVAGVNPVALLNADKVLMTRAAVEQLGERLK